MMHHIPAAVSGTKKSKKDISLFTYKSVCLSGLEELKVLFKFISISLKLC